MALPEATVDISSILSDEEKEKQKRKYADDELEDLLDGGNGESPQQEAKAAMAVA